MYKKKVEKNRGLYIAISILMFFAILYFALHIWGTWSRYSQSKRRLVEAQKSYQDLEGQYKELQSLQNMESSTTGYEMQVRSKFDLVKDGENAVVITNSVPPEVPEKKTSIQKFFDIFKNFFN